MRKKLNSIFLRNYRLKDVNRNLKPNLLIFNELQSDAGFKPAADLALRLLTDNSVFLFQIPDFKDAKFDI